MELKNTSVFGQFSYKKRRQKTEKNIGSKIDKNEHTKKNRNDNVEAGINLLSKTDRLQ